MALADGSKICVVIAALIAVSQGLRCLTCDNQAYGDACIEAPESISGASTTCQAPNDEYCYTSRVEEENGLKITLNRGCCRVKEHSSVCPPGDEFQSEQSDNPPYIKYLTRCSGDLCNDDTGNTGGDESEAKGGVLIVDGKSGASANSVAAAALVCAAVALVGWSSGAVV